MKLIITEELWNVVKEFLPHRKSDVGRPSSDPRKALNGIVYVLFNGIYWHQMPTEFGKASTIHGLFMKWTRAGVFEEIYAFLVEKYQLKTIDNNWYAIDTSSKKAPFANNTLGGPNSTDRAKQGIKQVFIVDRKGAPIKTMIAPANVHDSKLLKPLLRTWQPKENPLILAADAAYDSKKLRAFCKSINVALIAATNPRRNKNLHKTKVPYRWVVERTIGWFSWFRGLKTCWSKLLETSLSFLQLACSIKLFKLMRIFV